MSEEIMSFDLNSDQSSIIKVIGVGGGGSNAVDHMHDEGIKDVDFIVCNTDAQALEKSPVSTKIQIGESLTGGRGAGNNPEIGKQAAIENLNEVMQAITDNTQMVFITAGMGGGTGTGGAPVIAKSTKDAGILTVAIVTIPFRFEGKRRHEQAVEGLDELSKIVDSLLVINNEKLREVYGNLKISQAFSQADNVIASAAKGIAEIVTVPGYINVDFADVQTVMRDSGVAIMGSAKAEGESRASRAIKEAATSPLLNNNDIRGAENILLNITSGEDEISMDEVTEVTDYVSEAVSQDALIIWGTGVDKSLGDEINVTIIATGFEANVIPELYSRRSQTHKVPLHTQNHSQYQNNRQPASSDSDIQFEVKNKKKKEDQPDQDLIDVFQQSIDFEESAIDEATIGIDDEAKPDKQNAEPPEKSAERMKNIKETQAQLKDKRSHLMDKKNIEELENEPAFRRKKVRLNEGTISTKKEVSRFSLFNEENSDSSKLNSDNSYLHDNVD